MQANSAFPYFTPGPSNSMNAVTRIFQDVVTDRAVAVEIANYSSRHDLHRPHYHTSSGHNFIPPAPTIRRNSNDICAFMKTAGTACGSVGVLTYQFDNHTIAIMFSNPFDYKMYSIWHGLAIFDGVKVADNELFNHMYNDEAHNMKRQKVDQCGGCLELNCNGIYVKATMSSAAKAIMKVEVWDVSA
ncbi:DELTA-thalatoxin-Avl1a-like [Protopterus annectens]|uniref:DELTA-thalatoxin-Avl1a-like n=1 Tax=Protopterus annectens TaxID=7888 RepID=UPI001CF9F18E|nr:DELTA-thalatoxin-Avl1a-like [Protopterus annectens]XP_043920024.1 DELTA-thalatoxin-Avl1a-like [Protopterus annectens]